MTSDLGVLRGQDALVVPGVGSFAACMAGIQRSGGVALIEDWAAADRPLLGICVGHQVLFSHGTEHGVATSGIGLYEGSVEQLPARRLPHMGWNTVEAPLQSGLFAGLGSERFYFVHSFAATLHPAGSVVTTAEHEGFRFVAAVQRGNLASTQFHPEKSGNAGARLIANWLRSIG